MNEKEMMGKKFGHLTVIDIAYLNKGTNYIRYLCKCDCGNIILADEIELTMGYKESCDCTYYNEIFQIECKRCKEKIEIPFNKKKSKKYIEESYVDSKGKQHYNLYYKIGNMCERCIKYVKSVELNDKSKKYLVEFVEEKCLIEDNIVPRKRTLKSEFRNEYYKWLNYNNKIEYKLRRVEIDSVLKEQYDEKNIKSNGLMYLTKIRLVD